MNKPVARPVGSTATTATVTASEGSVKAEAAAALAQQEFDMVAVTKVTVGDVDYAPDEPFKVAGIDTARWLERQKAAKFASPGSVPAEAATSTGTTDEQSSSSSGS
jgi:hypothetical protein